MEKKNKEHILPLILLSFFSVSAGADNCSPASCGPTEPTIRYPFHIIGRQPSSCGFPGFSISCNKLNQTIIQLPSSRSYVINRINYFSQVVYIDPGFCRPNGIHTINLTATPFDLGNLRTYTFYNCSLQNIGFMYPATPFPCLSTRNYSVIAVPGGLVPPGSMSSGCRSMKTIGVPGRWNRDIRSELELMWFGPSCRTCETQDGGCGQSGCVGSSPRGFSTSAKYGLSLGIGLPASICLIGLICYTASRARDYNESRHQSVDLFSISIVPQPPSRVGLDGATIESYPKTELGESCRLPNDDSTCAICLSEYKPKESLRTIPECNHYFHADCIDEWLKLNATCPVCRNSPDSSSLVTPCSSASTTSVDSS